MLRSLMSRTHKIVNLIGVPAPLVGLVAAIVLLWNRMIGPLELALLVGFYVITALGITLGFHRMFTHRAFESSRPFRAIVAAMGSMAIQGSVITWVADHRKHHAFTDQDGDPHSPHGHGPGFAGAVKGLWHAHVGWSNRSAPPSASASRPTSSATARCASSTSCSSCGWR
jgi:stearoyl-CoA desaturase (delta-9 desaturase)